MSHFYRPVSSGTPALAGLPVSFTRRVPFTARPRFHGRVVVVAIFASAAVASPARRGCCCV